MNHPPIYIASNSPRRRELLKQIHTKLDFSKAVNIVKRAGYLPLIADWLKSGAHVNLVGSSYAGPVEADNTLVVRSRFIADSREGILAQGAEFLAAKAAGLVTDEHVVGEIGQVFAGMLPSRESPDQLTVYKSIGHIVQDLAAASALA